MKGPSASSVKPWWTKLKWAKSMAFSIIRPAEASQNQVSTRNTRQSGLFQSSSGQGGRSAAGASGATHTAPWASRTWWHQTRAWLGMAPPAPRAGMWATAPDRSYCQPW